MSSVTVTKGKFTLRAYVGDAKTLLAFNLPTRSAAKNLAGFTIQCQPDGGDAYYIHNVLQYKTPGDHAQDPKEPPTSSVNAPIHKFRWTHIPGTVHQGLAPFYGKYRYTVVPRFFDDNQSLLPLDPDLAASVNVNVAPFEKGDLALGFARGFVQSQAFVNHFGKKALIRPKGKDLQFDTTQQSGTNAVGESYTYLDQYQWLGFTARALIFGILEAVTKDRSLHLDVFAYDFNEPDIVSVMLKLAPQGRVRIILDNAALHHSKTKPKPEDEFEKKFRKVAKNADDQIQRGHFGRYAHDKVFIISKGGQAIKVLTGSTNFSVTGMYVNSNHVLVFDDKTVAAKYAEVFEEAWDGHVKASFKNSGLAKKSSSFSSSKVPSTTVTFSPHDETFASDTLNALVERIQAEGKKKKDTGSVLFACMELAKGSGPVYPALRALHTQQNIFTYGISDSPGGIYLYAPRSKKGVLVTGKPVGTILPPPFNQVPGLSGHQVHHKFVVCGFNGDDPTVYCGSSNLALGGEESNGDNLLCIRDEDVATVFAIEALGLVDHFDFLDRYASKSSKKSKTKKAPVSKQQAAATAEWFLGVTDKWVEPYYDPNDLHCTDRQLFS